MKTITIEWLTEHDACHGQQDLFAKTFPKGARITLANCQKAVREGLNLYWLAEKLFPATALKAYQDATAPAEKAYKDATATAWKAYQDATATLFFACAQKMES